MELAILVLLVTFDCSSRDAQGAHVVKLTGKIHSTLMLVGMICVVTFP